MARQGKTLPARRMWDVIMTSTYDFAEPGFILIDRVNEMNNNWFCENIRATNPCGEQPLPPYGSCLLGSVNLTRFVKHPFTDFAEFDWTEYREVVKVFTRMLDNVVEVNGLPLEQQRDEMDHRQSGAEGHERGHVERRGPRGDVVDDHVGAGLGQLERARAADPARAAGDQRHFACQIDHRWFLGSCLCSVVAVGCPESRVATRRVPLLQVRRMAAVLNSAKGVTSSHQTQYL